MANSFSLDDIRAAADKKYGHTELAGVVLLNPIRLSKAKRDELSATQDKLKAEDVDQVAVLEDLLRVVAKDPSAVEGLIIELGGDLGQLMAAFEFYTQETEAGEA